MCSVSDLSLDLVHLQQPSAVQTNNAYSVPYCYRVFLPQQSYWIMIVFSKWKHINIVAAQSCLENKTISIAFLILYGRDGTARRRRVLMVTSNYQEKLWNENEKKKTTNKSYSRVQHARLRRYVETRVTSSVACISPDGRLYRHL